MQDIYYDNNFYHIKRYFPDFQSFWAEEKLQYLILGDLYDEFLKNFNNLLFKKSFFCYVEDAITNGGTKTQELLIVEVFEHYMYTEKFKIDNFRNQLLENSRIVFDSIISSR